MGVHVLVYMHRYVCVCVCVCGVCVCVSVCVCGQWGRMDNSYMLVCMVYITYLSWPVDGVCLNAQCFFMIW